VGAQDFGYVRSCGTYPGDAVAAAVPRVSQLELKPAAGFRAELAGLDLATLVQLTCARRERMVARISSQDPAGYAEEGYLFSVAGRVVHATLGDLVGEEAVVRMLGWHSGDFVLCELPFPARATIQRSTEGLLLLAAKRADDSALDEVLNAAAVQPAGGLSSEPPSGHRHSQPPRESTPAPARPSQPPSRVVPTPRRAPREQSAGARVEARVFATPLPPAPSYALPLPTVTQSMTYSAPIAVPAARSLTPPAAPWDMTTELAQPATSQPQRQTMLPPAELRRSRLPPPPPPAARRSLPPTEPLGATPPATRRSAPAPGSDAAQVASVRVDAGGALVASHGAADHLAQLTAYVAQLLGLVRADFSLEPFEALYAELLGLRLLVYPEAGDVVGVLMQPGPAAQALRAELGI
jgi:hypothetical protein